MEKKELTEEYLIKQGFYKWGRDDMPVTLSYEKGKLTVAPLSPHGNFGRGDKRYGAIWIKDHPDDLFSWRPLIIFKYESDLETFLKVYGE